MELETYEIILILVAIVATAALIYWALNRGAQAPNDAGRATGVAADRDASGANREASAATGKEDSLAPGSGVPRARDAAKSRSGSVRRTATKPGASSGRAAAASAGGEAQMPSDEPSGQIQHDDAPAPEPSPAPEPQPAPEPPSVSGAKPSEPSEAPAAPPGKSVGGSPPARDNLTVIRGIGKSIEKKLNAMGITTFEQIASWTREDLDRVDAALAFPGRAQRENWVGQAKTLANKK